MFWRGKLCFYKLVKVVCQAYCTETDSNVNRSDLHLSSTELVSFLFHRLIFSHTVIIICDNQNDQLCTVTNIGTIIVVSVIERQVYEVVKKEKNGKTNNYQRRENVLIFDSNVVTESVSVPQWKHEIKLTHQSWFEFVFELSELFSFRKHQQGTNSKNETWRQ